MRAMKKFFLYIMLLINTCCFASIDNEEKSTINITKCNDLAIEINTQLQEKIYKKNSIPETEYQVHSPRHKRTYDVFGSVTIDPDKIVCCFLNELQTVLNSNHLKDYFKLSCFQTECKIQMIHHYKFIESNQKIQLSTWRYDQHLSNDNNALHSLRCSLNSHISKYKIIGSPTCQRATLHLDQDHLDKQPVEYEIIFTRKI